MNREILFRGKTGYGEWVYGMPVANTEGVITHITYCKKEFFEELGEVLTHEVTEKTIPETVGQYTGLDDKNGVKIFEGDVVKGHYYICGDKKRLIGKVKFRRNIWIVDGVKQYNRVEEGLTSNYEVIGNIYDNPELFLGGGAMNYEQIESSQRQQYETARHDEAMYALRLQSDYMLFSLLKPKVYPDGDMWCVLYGENIQDGITGFGSTIHEAIIDFNSQFHKRVGEV